MKSICFVFIITSTSVQVKYMPKLNDSYSFEFNSTVEKEKVF